MNWIDVIIIVILGIYAIRGFWKGLIAIFIELAGYIFSYLIALKYGYAGLDLLKKYTSISIPNQYQGTVGIVVIWLIIMIAYYIIMPFVLKAIPSLITNSIINKAGGIIFSVAKGLLFISIALFVINIFPLSTSLKVDIQNSKIASTILGYTTSFANNITNNLYTTLKNSNLIPSNNSNDLIYLGYKISNTTIDTTDEKIMLKFINDQRDERGITHLKENSILTEAARNYGKYMFANGFFSHNTPGGQSPVDRLNIINFKFKAMGENIAKAPDVTTADNGLMNSAEHRDNILNNQFTDIGVGIIDGTSVYGKIFVQEFASI